MQSILGMNKEEIIEKKSRFIALAFHVENLEEIDFYLRKTRVDYPQATHYTYAYILDDNQQKYFDDGEPLRTAGLPILEVLKNNGLNDTLIIVIRYFGGIMLGASGLVRAYSKAAASVLKKAPRARKTTTYQIKVTCDYQVLGNLEKIIREQTEFESVDYAEEVTFFFRLNADNLEMMKEKIFNHNNYNDRFKILAEQEEYLKIVD